MSKNFAEFPDLRLRRLRKNATIRNMLAAPLPGPEKFVWPVFVVEGTGVRQPLTAMPGQFRYSIDTLIEAVGEVRAMGVRSLMIFGVAGSECKTPSGDYGWSPDGIVQRAVRALKAAWPDLVIFTDVCLCEYTSHGHCGALDDSGNVVNDHSLELLAKIALSHAAAGADAVAPSAMMDGQVATIRQALESAGHQDTLLLSYSTKFASGMYGPFREAANSAPSFGDRKTYQADWRNLRAAMLESLLDENEGADMLMVKPSLFYLDIICRLKESSLLPVAAYNVSGEYSMLIAASERGWGDLKTLARESIGALARAGADIFISYWANQYDKMLKE
jgi:porphobilinogen synthase